MSNIISQITAILLGTNKNKTVTIIAHLIFWVCIYQWFLFQAQWVTGDGHEKAFYLIGLQKYLTIICCFYSISAVLRLKTSNLKIAVYIILILALTLFSYGTTVYLVYNYINQDPSMPSYFRFFVKNISHSGIWTFIKDKDVLYFHFEQLGLGIFPPLMIKIFRVAFQSKLDKLKLEKDNLELELNFLRSQINPHFLFNTLNSVYSLIEDKDEVAASIVFSLSNMMRYALYDSNTSEVEVNKELNFIKSYIDIQNIRHSKRLSIEMDFTDMRDFRIPPLLLINFVENAFKHGVDKIAKDSWIRINATIDPENKFSFQISNLKPLKNGQKSVGGIGFSNTKRRLNILYPERHLLEITEDELTYNLLLKIW
jgi:two-component system LytT family sensor kinase